MRLAGRVVLALARTFGGSERLARRISNVFYGMLPALLAPSDLGRLVRDFYVPTYADQRVAAHQLLAASFVTHWEADVFDRYRMHAGRVLVLGAGSGREAIALARRGLTVVGVEANGDAVRMARAVATVARVSARFHQADFLELPYASATFDYVALLNIMYSSVAGQARRQAWLAELARLLTNEGRLVISFLAGPYSTRRRAAVLRAVTRALTKLPGANAAYQTGDVVVGGHFFHRFASEAEIRGELLGAGVAICELDWSAGFAVLRRRRHDGGAA